MSVRTMTAVPARRGVPPLLDVAAEVLVADPAASLAEVAEAAGIGRTTLHKHYATRDDLIRAVGHRAIDLWEQAALALPAGPPGPAEPPGPAGAGAPVAGLRAFAAAMIPIGAQLAFLWRTPAFDHDREISERWAAAEARSLAVLTQARDRGALAGDVPDWWLLQTFYSLIYVAAESVRAGRLAPRDAPDRVLGTYLHGIGAPSPAS